MKIIAQKYMQEGQEFYSMVLPFNKIDKSSKVLVYNEDIYGYQRKLDRKHFNAIKKALLIGHEPLPTSIILSVDKEEFDQYIFRKDLGNEYYYQYYEVDIPDKEIFRIVDGQHRIEGLKEAAKVDSKFNDFPLNVIVLVTREETRVKEVLVFRDINSKAKKLKTDLTLLAIYNYELLHQKKIQSQENLINHLTIRVAHLLNNTRDSVWYNAIQFDIHEKDALGIIGVSPMVNSLKNIVKIYIIHENIEIENLGNLGEEHLIDCLNNFAETISRIISEAWEIVELKWPKCFKEQIVMDISETNYIKYMKDYYIQKTTGVNAIHAILHSHLNLSNESNLLKDFKDEIMSSPLKEIHWKIGGPFSGLTSQSGFKMANRIIKEGI